MYINKVLSVFGNRQYLIFPIFKQALLALNSQAILKNTKTELIIELKAIIFFYKKK